MAKQLKKEKDTRKPWAAMPTDAYVACLPGLGHLFSKPVNTNAAPVCIRMNVPASQLPYVSVSTLGSHSVPLEFSGISGQLKAAGQLLAVLEGSQDTLYFGVDAESKDIAESLRADCEAVSSSGTGQVDARLRQVLIPIADDNYVAITPLHSAGLSMLINMAVKHEKETGLENGIKYGYRKPAIVPVGGSNPQNVGLRTRELGRPLVFNAPAQHQPTRLAYAYHFSGISLVPPVPMIAAYRVWLHKQKKYRKDEEGNIQSAITGQLDTRNEEATFIAAMAKAVLTRALHASELLSTSSFAPLLSEKVDAPVAALLDAAMRYPGWENEVANRILRGVATTELTRRDTEYAHAEKPDDFALLPYRSMVATLVRSMPNA